MKNAEMSSREIAASQDATARDLLEHGARLVADPGTDKLRLELTTQDTAILDKKGNKEGGQLEDAQLVNKMVSINQERDAKKLSYQTLIEGMQAHPAKYFGFIIEHFGSLEKFQALVDQEAANIVEIKRAPKSDQSNPIAA